MTELSVQMEQRYARLTTSAERLRGRRSSGSPGRLLYLAGGALVSLGFGLVVLGYIGVSHTIYVFEQMPYLVSGGILGGCLVIAGCFSFFAFWLTRIHAELQTQRATTQLTVDSLQHVERLLAQLVDATAPSPRRKKAS